MSVWISESFELGWLCTSITVSGEFKFEFDWKQVLLQFCVGLIGVLFMFDLRLKEGGNWKVEGVLWLKFDFFKVLVWFSLAASITIEEFDNSSRETGSSFIFFLWMLVCRGFVWGGGGLERSVSLLEKLESVFGQEYFLLHKICTNTIKNVHPNLKKQHLWSS